MELKENSQGLGFPSALSHYRLWPRPPLLLLVLAKGWVGWGSAWHNLLALAHLVYSQGTWMLPTGYLIGVSRHILLSVMSGFQFRPWRYLLHLPDTLLPLLYSGALTGPLPAWKLDPWL